MSKEQKALAERNEKARSRKMKQLAEARESMRSGKGAGSMKSVGSFRKQPSQ